MCVFIIIIFFAVNIVRACVCVCVCVRVCVCFSDIVDTTLKLEKVQIWRFTIDVVPKEESRKVFFCQNRKKILPATNWIAMNHESWVWVIFADFLWVHLFWRIYTLKVNVGNMQVKALRKTQKANLNLLVS